VKFQTTGNKRCDYILQHVSAIQARIDEAIQVARESGDKEGVALFGKLLAQAVAIHDYYRGVGEVEDKAREGAYVVEDECWICGKKTVFQYVYDKPGSFTCKECEVTYLNLLQRGPSLDGFECAADVWAITTAAKRTKKPKPMDEDIRYALYRTFGVSGDAVPPEPKVKLSEGKHLPNDYIETSTGEDNDANEEGKDSTEAG
jgi:hypothetical protein